MGPEERLADIDALETEVGYELDQPRETLSLVVEYQVLADDQLALLQHLFRAGEDLVLETVDVQLDRVGRGQTEPFGFVRPGK